MSLCELPGCYLVHDASERCNAAQERILAEADAVVLHRETAARAQDAVLGDVRGRLDAKKAAEDRKAINDELVALVHDALGVRSPSADPSRLSEWQIDRARNIVAAIVGNYIVTRRF